ncbi:MAG TPA: hypothetical protein VHY22_04955, partial [Chthoniobacteraceae bacterium]|nr:hypothetical protein [Chthoniobacteraceae bacterium]
MKKPHLPRRGIALVLVLVFLVMITVLAVGLSAMMRIERPAASSHFEKARATQLAQQGVEAVVGLLDQNTTSQYWISQPGRLIVTSGTASASATAAPVQNPLQMVIPLSTGTTAMPTLTPQPPNPQLVDLNVTTLQDPTSRVVTGAEALPNPAMQVNWVYLTRDGTPSVTLADNSGATPAALQWIANPAFQPDAQKNPIVGRYAYWADDESTKVNENIAWGRSEVGNSSPQGDPTNVSLTALASFSATMANALHLFVTADGTYSSVNRFYDTPKAARVVTSATDALASNDFEMTYYSHDPGTTFFNQPRIVLTTRPDRAGWTYNKQTGKWVGQNGQSGDPVLLPNGQLSPTSGTPPYLRILNNEGTQVQPGTIPGAYKALDPGYYPNMENSDYSCPRLNDTINFLVAYLQRTDWPMTSSTSSFQSKYYSNYPAANQAARLAQIAINIIDYVRSEESPDPVVPPLRINATVSSGSTTYTFQNIANTIPASTYVGNTRMPFFTEVGAYLDKVTDPKAPQMRAAVELYWPPSYQIPTPINVTSLGIYITDLNNTAVHADTTPLTTTASGDQPSSTTLPAANGNPYITVNLPISYGTATATGTFNWRVALSYIVNGSSYMRTDVAPLVTSNYNGSGPSAAGPTVTLANYDLHIPFDPSWNRPQMQTLECDDPRVNFQGRIWKLCANGSNTLGQQNTAWTAGTPATGAYSPQQDADAAGNISTASFYMPAPAGTGSNTLGYVTSVGDLGYIDTGIESNDYGFQDPTNPDSPLIPYPLSVPWRTLRLQPNNYPDTSVVPDWALMDLFTVPSVRPNAAPVYAPHGTMVGGRVNLNSTAEPFYGSTGLEHTLPLAAVLQGCGTTTGGSAKLSPSAALGLASNLVNDVNGQELASGNGNTGKAYGVPAGWPQSAPLPYVSPGEICEIKGIADGGEASEEMVREAGNLLTVRGDVFTVYSVGQALKE